MDPFERFKTGGVEEVHLPTGAVIYGRVPSLEDLLIHDLVPADLLAVAQTFAASDDLPDVVTMTEAEKRDWYRFLRMLVAGYVRGYRDDAGNFSKIPSPLTIDDTFNMDSRDVAELECIVTRIKSARQVSAIWRAARGEITEEEAQHIFTAEAANTIVGWATFRRILESAVRRANGAPVRPDTEPDVRPNRASRRAGAKRGARSAPGDRNERRGQRQAAPAGGPTVRGRG